MANHSEDYYKILGIDKSATDKEIQRAFRKLAHKYHPDSNTTKEAEEKFKKINEAYNVLKDPEKRKAYDQFGNAWEQGAGFNPNDYANWGGDSDVLRSVFESIFRSQHGGQAQSSGFGGFDFGGFSSGFGGGYQQRPRAQQGQNLNAKITITAEEAYLGGAKDIRIHVPDANGLAVSKNLSVTIPKQIANGKKIRLKGQGHNGINGGQKGDLIIEVEVIDSKEYKIHNLDIHKSIPVFPYDVVFGTKVEVEVFDKKVEIKIPKGTKPGQKFRIKGKGLKDKNQTGDLYLVAQITIPEDLSKEETKLLKQWKKLRN